MRKRAYLEKKGDEWLENKIAQKSMKEDAASAKRERLARDEKESKRKRLSFTKVCPDAKRRSVGKKTLRRRSPRGMKTRGKVYVLSDESSDNESDSEEECEEESEDEDAFLPSDPLDSEEVDSSEDCC